MGPRIMYVRAVQDVSVPTCMNRRLSRVKFAQSRRARTLWRPMTLRRQVMYSKLGNFRGLNPTATYVSTSRSISTV